MSDQYTPARNITPVPQGVPESSHGRPKYNRWRPEPVYRYASGDFREGERVEPRR